MLASAPITPPDAAVVLPQLRVFRELGDGRDGTSAWLFGEDEQRLGIFMIFWGLVVTVVGNFIKPFLIGVGVEMRLSLTILGVFAGFVAYGVLGLFIGPTLIAIAFTVLEIWRGAPAETPVGKA